MEFALEEGDRGAGSYLELIVDAYVRVLYREGDPELGSTQPPPLEARDAGSLGQDAIAP